MNFLPTITGLCLALGGPALVASFGDQCFGHSESLTSKLLQQMALATLLGTIVWIVLVWEQRSLSSIGLHSFRWQSIVWGLVCAGGFIFIYSPLLIWAMNKVGLAGFENGLAKLTSLPSWYLVVAVVVGGTVEEGLYRGYATERLSWLTGHYWLGSALALAAFGLAHVPLWGRGAACTTVLSGGILTVIYLWTGDLLTAIIAHIITDSVGILLPSLERTRSVRSVAPSEPHL